MKIADGVYILEIAANVMGRPDVIYPSVIWQHQEVILVDTGFPGQLAQIQEAFIKDGVPFDQLSQVIITHQDIDHVGSLASILAERPGQILLSAHSEEKAFIQGDQVPVKVAQLAALLPALPKEGQAIYEKMKTFYETNRSHVDKTLADGEELPGGITVIFTPGHTPGHICLYIQQSRTLIAGDTLYVENNQLIRAAESTNYDLELSRQSLKKLLEYDIQAVICYHGGLFRGDANKRIAELAD